MSTATIQPNYKDVFLMEPYATTNSRASSSDRIEVNGRNSPNRARGLLSFDFSASVPSGSTITSAVLSLYVMNYYAGRTIYCYRLLRGDYVEDQATWNIYKTGSNWSASGALSDGNDFTTTDAATSASLSSRTWQSWTVTAQVQTALDSVSGVAHFLLADLGGSSTDKIQDYDGRSYADVPARRPKLVIEYTAPAASTFIPKCIFL